MLKLTCQVYPPLLEFAYEFTSNRHNEFMTQLPFELKLAMPMADRGGRFCADEYAAKQQRQLSKL